MVVLAPVIKGFRLYVKCSQSFLKRQSYFVNKGKKYRLKHFVERG